MSARINRMIPPDQSRSDVILNERSKSSEVLGTTRDENRRPEPGGTLPTSRSAFRRDKSFAAITESDVVKGRPTAAGRTFVRHYNALMRSFLVLSIALAAGCGGSGPASDQPPVTPAPSPETIFTFLADAAPSTGGGLSRGAAWGDLDNDGDPDLAVANAIGQAQMLYRNDGPGGFALLEDDQKTEVERIYKRAQEYVLRRR